MLSTHTIHSLSEWESQSSEWTCSSRSKPVLSLSLSLRMTETNEDSTLNPDLDPDPNPNKSETRRRLLTKSKTIVEEAGSTPHFRGPLFPVVRRISTLPNPHTSPRPSDLPVSVTGGDDPSWPHPNNANDREWIYPPLLGAYPARGQRPRLDKTRRITAPVDSTDNNDNNNRDSDSKKPLVEPRRQVSVASTSSVSQLAVGRSREFKLLLSLYLVSYYSGSFFFCFELTVVSVWLLSAEKVDEKSKKLSFWMLWIFYWVS